MGPLARIARLFTAVMFASTAAVARAPAEPAPGGTKAERTAPAIPADRATAEPRYRLDPVTVTPGRLPMRGQR